MSSRWARFGLGRALYQAWYRPRGALLRMAAAGGPLEQWRTERGRRRMVAAAHSLPQLPAGAGAPLEVHILTGRRVWYQTAFCLWTFARQSGRPVSPVIYDDGTLSEKHSEPIQRLFPSTRVLSRGEVSRHLDVFLPATRFPSLRERWLNYPNIRKLIDVHAGRTGWKLVMDSDLLFFHPPHALVGWLDDPGRPLHAVDCETSYGYSGALMEALAGFPIRGRINVGLTGLDSGSIDWERLEHFCSTLLAKEGSSYFLEQALVAMLVSDRECLVAPEEDYVTLPQEAEANLCHAVMHHYVADSKKWYFRKNWRRALS